MANLLSLRDLPSSFSYPAEFIRAAELGVLNLEPWMLLEGEVLRERLRGLRDRYPDRQLIPFAARQDSDDIACWSADKPGAVLVVHDFASVGYEIDREFDDFYAWLRQAVEDFIDWDS